MKWQKSHYKDTNANDADIPGCHATKKNTLMSAQNVRVHIGINQGKNQKKNYPLHLDSYF
jgi:hypothetical protein